MDGAALRRIEGFEGFWEEPEAEPAAKQRPWIESDLEFYTRRATEERRLAAKAPTATIAAAHLYLAASYSAKMAAELTRLAELEKLALSIAD